MTTYKYSFNLHLLVLILVFLKQIHLRAAFKLSKIEPNILRYLVIYTLYVCQAHHFCVFLSDSTCNINLFVCQFFFSWIYLYFTKCEIPLSSYAPPPFFSSPLWFVPSAVSSSQALLSTHSCQTWCRNCRKKHGHVFMLNKCHIETVAWWLLSLFESLIQKVWQCFRSEQASLTANALSLSTTMNKGSSQCMNGLAFAAMKIKYFGS